MAKASKIARVHQRLKLRSLDVLVAVIESRSMAHAAKHLALSQPAVSKAIAEMEHTLGVQLFDRTSQGVEPTRYALALRKSALAVAADVEQGIREIEFLADPTAGELRIGATEPMIAGFLPTVVQRMWRRHPNMRFHAMQTITRSDQDRELREHRIDIMVGRVPQQGRSDDIASEVLFNDPLYIAAGSDNPLARRRKVHLAELVDEPWSLPQPDTMVGAYINDVFTASGLRLPRDIVRSESIQMHYGLLTSGPFLALIPLSMLRYGIIRNAVKVLPVELPGVPPPVGVLRLKDRTISPVAELFIEYARAAAEPLVKGL